MSQQSSVIERYSEGAKAVQPELCCPVDYDTSLLALLPDEIIERDYGCGDPSRYVQNGDTVLDLGSGGGKICYMAAQLVGSEGHIIGVDMNDDMLALANKHRSAMSEKIPGVSVDFHKGYIQDLALDLTQTEAFIAKNPITDLDSLQALEGFQQQQRKNQPLIADNSIDLVISNCVLNLVDDAQKQKMVEDIFRVLKPGGRVAISDIVSDELIPDVLKNDPELWSGCISGAFHEEAFLQSFLDAGFVAVGYDKWDAEPWQVIEDIEFRSVTILATKPAPEACVDIGQAVIYKGPFSEVYDDEDHVYPRGKRIAVCERSFKLLTEGPYKNDFIGIQPAEPMEAVNWCQPAGTIRPVSETKGGKHTGNTENACC